MKISHIGFVFALSVTLPSLFAADLPQGYVIGWGNNALYGCNGIPSPRDSAGVVTIGNQVLTNTIALAAGSNTRWAILSDGTVFGWGLNDLGSATGFYSGTEATNGIVKVNGIILSNVVAISPNGLAVRCDGTVAGWQFNRDTNLISGLSNIVAISGNFALKADGMLVAWGNGIHGENLAVPVGLSNVVAIAAGGWDYGMALKKDGTVVEWYGGTPTPSVSTVAGLMDVVAIASGPLFHLALKKDGTVFGWGVDDVGEATGVATRGDAKGLVTINGQVLNNVVAIAANGGISPSAGNSLALRKDGTVVYWGYNPYHRLDVPHGLSNVVAIAAGHGYCLAITTNAAIAERFMPKGK
jgi:alpha-tubulin suppressor-like RCC1 family protein